MLSNMGGYIYIFIICCVICYSFYSSTAQTALTANPLQRRL